MPSTGRNLLTVSLREGIVRPTAPLVVDREKGVIFGVKIIGQESANRRRYTKEAIQGAIALYEGRAVNVDHPRKPTDSRSPYDRFGWLENVRLDDAGEAFGDLHVLDPKEEMAVKLFNAAERKPDLFGLSHNADGQGYTDDQGIFIVEKITEVRSVDLVSDPATTHGLSESRIMPKVVKKKSFLESALKKWKGDARLKTLCKRVLEMDAIPTDADMAVDDAVAAPDADPAEALKAGFKASGVALLDAALDGDGEAAKKLMDLIKSHAKVNPTSTGTTEEEEEETDKATTEEEDPKEADKKDETVKESRRISKELADLKKEKKIRELCEDADLKPTRDFVKTLMEAGSDNVIKHLISQEKKIQGGTGKRTGPQSRPASGHVPEGRVQIEFKTTKEFVESICD